MMIRDPLRGNIELSDFEKRIIDTSDFQRLRRVRQLAMAYMIYPGAMHTRFEHSLGTMQLATSICSRLGIEGEEAEKTRLYALLHDLGHVAFSHDGERATEKALGTHEKIGERKLLEGEVGEVVSERFRPSEILEAGKGRGEQIVAGDIGADRMDYLGRDAYHIGVAYGTIDTDRILHTLMLEDGQVCVHKSGLEAAESLLIGRFMMFSTVYLHKTVRISSAMLKRAISAALSSGGVKAEDFLSMGDEEAMLALQRCEGSRPYAEALANRRFYKQAYSLPASGVDGKMGEELSKECSCEVIVDLPNVPSKLSGFVVKTPEGTKNILEISGLVKALLSAEEERMLALVICPAENREKVRSAAEAYCTK